MNQNQEEQQRQELQKELERLEKQTQDLKEQKQKGVQDVEAQKQLKEDLIKITEKLDVKTEKNGAIFNDNEVRWAFDAENNKIQQININEERAKKFCERPENSHCKTIGDTEGGKWLEDQKIYDLFSKEDTTEVWNHLSEKYAREAKGETHAFVKVDSAEHRTWEVAEKPTLRSNEEVTEIIYHYHPTPDREVVRRENLARPEKELDQDVVKVEASDKDRTWKVNVTSEYSNGEKTARNFEYTVDGSAKEVQQKVEKMLENKQTREMLLGAKKGESFEVITPSNQNQQQTQSYKHSF